MKCNNKIKAFLGLFCSLIEIGCISYVKLFLPPKLYIENTAYPDEGTEQT